MRELAVAKGMGGDYVFQPVSATHWDADRSQGCLADDLGHFHDEYGNHFFPPAEGTDLLELGCPDGLNGLHIDRPTSGDHSLASMAPRFEIQKIVCSYTSAHGTFKLFFKGHQTPTIRFDATQSDLKAALEAVPSTGTVSVNASTAAICGNGAASELTTFLNFTQLLGDQPRLQVMSASASLAISVETVSSGKGYVFPCGGRGQCNGETGLCKCLSGYGTSNGFGETGTRGDCGASTIS
jgi:hypothetical protein